MGSARKRRAARRKLKAHDTHTTDRHNKGVSWLQKQARKQIVRAAHGVKRNPQTDQAS